MCSGTTAFRHALRYVLGLPGSLLCWLVDSLRSEPSHRCAVVVVIRPSCASSTSLVRLQSCLRVGVQGLVLCPTMRRKQQPPLDSLACLGFFDLSSCSLSCWGVVSGALCVMMLHLDTDNNYLSRLHWRSARLVFAIASAEPPGTVGAGEP